MFVFIKSKDFVKALRRITLSQIELQLPANFTLAQFQTEFAWHKIILLEYIILKIEDQIIAWKLNTSFSDKSHIDGEITVTNKQGCNIQQFFTSLKTILCKQANDKITEVIFYDNVIELLHTHILPVVTFQPNCMPVIEKAINKQKKLLKEIEKSMEYYSVQLQMASSRQNEALENTLLNIAEDKLLYYKYPEQFLKNLIDDTIILIESFEYHEDRKPSKRKHNIPISTSKQGENAEKYIKFMIAKDRINTFLTEPKNSTFFIDSFEDYMDDNVRLYIEYREVPDQMKTDLECAAKTHAFNSCVVEALEKNYSEMQIILKDVKETEDCLVIKSDANELDSLADEVDKLLKENKNLSKKHDSLCIEIIKLCDTIKKNYLYCKPWEMLQEKLQTEENISESLPNSILPFIMEMSEEEKNCDNKEENVEKEEVRSEVNEMAVETVQIRCPPGRKRSVSVGNFVFATPKTLRDLPSYIHLRIEQMCQEIEPLFKMPIVNNQCMWEIYERCFSKATIKSIIDMFSAIYRETTYNLHWQLHLISQADLNLHNFLKDLYQSNIDTSAVYCQAFADKFTPAIDKLQKTLTQDSIMGMCETLVECLQKISDEIPTGSNSADEIINIVILLLLHCSPEVTAKLYIIINLLNNLVPDFLQKGIYGYAIITFSMVYQFIFSILEKK